MTIGDTETNVACKSKGLSDKSVKRPTTPYNRPALKQKWI